MNGRTPIGAGPPAAAIWLIRVRCALAAVSVAIPAAILFSGCDSPTDKMEPGFTIDDPYAGGGEWLRANFHLHSTHSHGLMAPAELVAAYAGAGYGAIAITDHNQYGDQDGGVFTGLQTDTLLHDWNGDGAVHPIHERGSGSEAYVRDYTAEPPAYRRDRWFRPPGVPLAVLPLTLPGFEASWSYFGAHFGLVGFPPGPVAPPAPGFEWLDTAAAAGAFAYIAHPGEANSVATRFARTLPLERFDALEIMNGVRLTGLNAPPADATPLWDSLLTQGHRLWGMANDDAHQFPGAAEQFPFSAYDMVLCREQTQAGVLDALHRGAFYASTGLRFATLRIRSGTLLVEVPDAGEIVFIGSGGRVLQSTPGGEAAYVFQGTEGYVRVEARGAVVVSPLTTWRKSVWSQPFRVLVRPNGPA